MDVFDALTTDRPYKAALSYRSAAGMIARERAVHFDPEVVEGFLGIPFRVLVETARRYGVVLKEVCPGMPTPLSVEGEASRTSRRSS